MDKPLHPLGTQEVLLHASYPPTHPDRLCDWTITSVTGELPPDTLAYSEWFVSLPSRVETVSILNTLAFEYLVIILIMVWAIGLSRRSGSFPIRRAIDDSGKIWLKTLRDLVDGVTVLASFMIVGVWGLKSSMALLAFWAALGGGLLDSAGLLLVVVLVFNNQMLPGICLSLAYVTWVASLSRLHWRHTVATRRLPDYKDFLASLRPTDDTARKQKPVREEQDDRNCMVCWSSDDVPLELPCKRNHLICSDCLARLHESHRHQCPICRFPLYTMLNIKTKLLELTIATLGAIFALTVIDIALAIYKGSYQDVAMVILFTALPTLVEVRYCEFSSAASGGYLASWQTWTLASHAFNLAVFACRSGDLLGRRDQATFIRGKFVSGVEMSTALTFSRGA
jgi:hypothetical protein